jgi:hypothetical protein
MVYFNTTQPRHQVARDLCHIDEARRALLPLDDEGPAPIEDADLINNEFAELIWNAPLKPKLEALAQGQQANLLPSWEETWPFLAVIAILWAALFTGFWTVSGFQSRPAR